MQTWKIIRIYLLLTLMSEFILKNKHSQSKYEMLKNKI